MLDNKKGKQHKVFIEREVLEESLKYLVCPKDQGELELNIANVDQVSEGEFVCRDCNSSYEIRNGVPYFSDIDDGYEWPDEINFAGSIAETITDRDTTTKKVMALSRFFISRFSTKQSIDNIFRIVGNACITAGADKETQAYLMQLATAARYDIEVYRGTFKIPENNFAFLQKNYRRGIVVEGACATGECLIDLACIASDFYLGLDISGNMARAAQMNAGKNMLFVQGDICSLPIKQNSVGIYVLNNVFDRVVDPPAACKQADRILGEQSYFVLSNCDPLQFGYRTKQGEQITFVPEGKQISLEQGLKEAGFDQIMEQRGMWNIETAAYGKESLPYKSLLGGRDDGWGNTYARRFLL